MGFNGLGIKTNIGHALETIVFHYLKRRGVEIKFVRKFLLKTLASKKSGA